MREVSRTDYAIKDIDVDISEITDGIYRISGFVNTFGITFNQFLIDDEKPMLIHTGPIGMYKRIEEKIKEVIPLQKLAYVSFLHFESDEWGGMAFLESAYAKLVCSDLSFLFGCTNLRCLKNNRFNFKCYIQSIILSLVFCKEFSIIFPVAFDWF